MFSRVFLICALAAAATAYQIGSYYQGVQTPEERYGYQYYLRLIGAGYPYQGEYKQYYPYASRYYGPAVGQEDIYAEPREQVYYPSYYYQQYQRYYPQYFNSLLRYPYFARYFQQYYNQPGYGVSPLKYEKQYQYEQQQDSPYYYSQYYNRVPYQQYGQEYGRVGYYGSQYQYPYQYQGRYYSSLLNRILGYQQQYQPEYVY